MRCSAGEHPFCSTPPRRRTARSGSGIKCRSSRAIIRSSFLTSGRPARPGPNPRISRPSGWPPMPPRCSIMSVPRRRSCSDIRSEVAWRRCSRWIIREGRQAHSGVDRRVVSNPRDSGQEVPRAGREGLRARSAGARVTGRFHPGLHRGKPRHRRRISCGPACRSAAARGVPALRHGPPGDGYVRPAQGHPRADPGHGRRGGGTSRRVRHFACGLVRGPGARHSGRQARRASGAGALTIRSSFREMMHKLIREFLDGSGG